MAARRTTARAEPYLAAARARNRQCRVDRPDQRYARLLRPDRDRSAPAGGECFEAALGIADLLIVPLTLSEVDLHATAQAIMVLHRMRAVRGGRPSCLLVPSKVDRRTSLGRQASTSLAKLGWAVGPALGQRTAHSDAFKAAKWIGAYAPGSAAEMEVRALVERIEDQLERCPQIADDYRPERVHADTPIPAATGLKSTPGAPVRLGALAHSLMVTVLAKLKRAEQQAFY